MGGHRGSISQSRLPPICDAVMSDLGFDFSKSLYFFFSRSGKSYTFALS